MTFRTVRLLLSALGVALAIESGDPGLVSVQAAEPVAPQFRSGILADTADANPYDMEIADFNADGNLDVALLTTQGGSKVHFALGDGNGNLRLENTLFVPYGVGLGSGDFNKDGLLDLAVTQSSNKVSRDQLCDPPAPQSTIPGTMIFLGTGGVTAPQFAFKMCLTAAGTYLNDAVTGDFNGDGFTDLVVGDERSRGARLYRGVGDGTFLAAINAAGSSSISVSALVTADVNKDGRLDVVARAGGFVGTFIGNGAGGLTFSSTAVGSSMLYQHSGVQAFAIGDVDNDGFLDIAGVERGILMAGGAVQNFFFVSLGSGTSYISSDTHAMPDGTMTRVVSADFNKDGSLDFAAVNQTNSRLSLYLGRGNGTFAAGPVLAVGVEPTLLAARDLNRDNWPDFIVVDRNQGSSSQSWTVQQIPGVGDSTPPVVRLTSPAAGSSVQGTVTATATATDASGIAKVEFLRNNIPIGSDTTADPGDIFGVPWITTNSPNGTYSVIAKGTDRFDNGGTSAAVSVTVANPDTTPPVATLSAPTAGAILSGAVRVAANATDFNGIAKVEFYLDTTLIGTAPTAPFEIQWNTVGTAVGAHLLKAKAYDPAPGNNSTASAAVSVTVDQPPAAVAGPLQRVEATSANGALIALKGTGTDPDAGDVLAYRWSENSVTLGTTASLNVTLSPGLHAPIFRVTDAAGLFAEDVAQIDVTDTTAPALKLPAAIAVEATSASGGAATFPVTATDAVDPLPAVACTPASGSVFPIGTNNVTCTARDASSNSASGSFTVTVRDTTAPTIGVVQPAAGARVSGNVIVQASASDAVGVSQVELFAGAQSLGVVTNAPYSATWNTAALPNGSVVLLRATARDAAGNSRGSANVSVTIDRPNTDTTAPVVTPPAAITIAATEQGGARANIASSTASQALAAFLAGGSAVDAVDRAPVRLAPQATLGGVMTDLTNTTLLPVGTTSVTFRYRDASGNAGTAASPLTVTAPVGGSVTAANQAVTPRNSQGATQPLTVSFGGISQAGLVVANQIASPPAAPSGWRLATRGFDVTTTALFTAPIQVCFTGQFTESGDYVGVYQNSAWADRTSLRASNRICATVSSFTPIAVIRRR